MFHQREAIRSSKPPQYTIGRGSKISNPDAKLFLSSSISSIEGCRCMMALIVLMGDDVFEAYELRLLDIIELFDGEDVRRNEVRMVEKDSDWKREVRMVKGVRLSSNFAVIKKDDRVLSLWKGYF